MCKGEICKISSQISINRWTFAIDFGNKEHRFSTLIEMLSPPNSIIHIHWLVLQKLYSIILILWGKIYGNLFLGIYAYTI